MTFIVVIVGWVISLTLHEFSHALVAYNGGDYTVKEKGYLTMNPIKYTHPVYSILLPLLFLVMGGIGLPGGAVYIETWRLYTRRWQSAVSLAGPAVNLLLAFIIGILLRFGPVTGTGIWPGLAFLGLLQVTAAIFNLLPVPPFDGYGAIRPYLNSEWLARMDSFAQVSMWVVLAVFWYVPFVSGIFWNIVMFIANMLGIRMELAFIGQNLFFFWR